MGSRIEQAPAQAPALSAEHPLDAMGLGTVNHQHTELMDMLGKLPGAAEEAQAMQGIIDQSMQPAPPPLVQQQQSGVLPAPPMTPQQLAQNNVPAEEFNAAFQEMQGDQQTQAPQAQPGQPGQLQAGQVVMGQDDYDFLVGLIEDQSAGLASVMAGQTRPQGMPSNGIVMPGAPNPPVPVPDVKPIVTPKVSENEITDAEFESLTTDRAAFSKFLAKRDANVAATVTEQVSQSVLPTVYAHIGKENDKQRAINTFLTNNPDLAQHPQALQAAVQDAATKLPLAAPERLLYYAAQRLRAAMGANAGIQQSVHDVRGQRPRRAPVMGNPRPVRVSDQPNLANINPFQVMKADMINHAQPGQGDILKDLGIR